MQIHRHGAATMQSSAVLQPKWSTVEEMGRGFLGWSAEGVAGTFLLALPPGAVGRILKSTHTVAQVVLPEGASVAFVVHGESGMQMLLDRVDVLAEMVMDGLLQRFRQHAAHLRVDAELAIVTRRQCADSLLLEGQMRYWRGQCALTSVKTSSVLRAVRFRRWEDCDTDAERLDVQNGLLLTANLAALFEDHLLTLDDEGRIIIATRLHWRDHAALGLSATMSVQGLTDAHRGYLIAHRSRFAARQSTPAEIQ